MPPRLEVRQSHIISDAAVGSITQIGGLSMVFRDIRYWRDFGEEVNMPRLARRLAKAFRKAPVRVQRGNIEVGGLVPAVRFPIWHFCPNCKQMYPLKADGRADELLVCPRQECARTNSHLAPMPWIMICSNGHMDDLPWQVLLHRNAPTQRQKTCQSFHEMFYNPPWTRDGRQRIVCNSCKAELDVDALTAENFLKGVRCRGRQPWLSSDGDCVLPENLPPQVASPGDHYVHFPDIISALDIPPESRIDPRNDIGRRIREHPDWHRLNDYHARYGDGHAYVGQLIAAIAIAIHCRPDDVRRLLAPRPGRNGAPQETDEFIPESHRLRQEEYLAHLAENLDYREYETFITVSKSKPWRDWLLSNTGPAGRIRNIIDLVSVTRIRELRVLRGFTRLFRFGTANIPLVPPDLNHGVGWLPAAEFFGEGVFFTLDRGALAEWQARTAVQARTETARKGFSASAWFKRIAITEESFPSFAVVHTLAHLLIREMAFQCGYPAASIRERLYFSDGDSPMAGALVYLAAGEPGGSLGGIARLAEPERFAKIISRCIASAAWCALDPVCSEHEGRGEGRLNRAACHACCLLPETSCECSNLMLDRRLISSGSDDNPTGFFD